MLAPQIKKKVDALWNKFWTAGITNPLVAIEQITYLLFLKRLEDLDNTRVKKGKPSIYQDTEQDEKRKAEQCRWSYIKQDKTPKHLLDVVFPWLRELEKKFAGDSTPTNGVEAIGNRMSDAYFQLDLNKGAILGEAIELIDGLFARVDTIGAAADVMGDTFEYLLSEIATAGKNGQFRTPRHLIRFMVEMLDPQPGDYIIDPAAGTGGFLFSSLNYILKQHTEPENLRLEWDGTPHRTAGERLSPEAYQRIHQGDFYIGLDNDRTMVRIGWMNLVLHGIENPQIHQRDSLGQRRSDDPLRNLLLSESYDRVFANPPYTGTVDTNDLERSLFPAAGKSGKKASEVITNKSELLFVWTMLDLLRVGGRCAVIVPEGVLFGSTEAHLRLRRELLTEHLVEAIISLPAGVFQPYTGVKTSILVFQKETRKEDRRQGPPVDAPRTQSVWFHEVSQEAFTLDAKRNERRGQDNDLWDALEKFKTRHDPTIDALAYYQPTYEAQRWRMVDQHTLDVFADVSEVRNCKDKVAAIHELFANLPTNPKEAEALITQCEQLALQQLALICLNTVAREAQEVGKSKRKKEERQEAVQDILRRSAVRFRTPCNQQRSLFEKEESMAWPLFQKAFQSALDWAIETLMQQAMTNAVIEELAYDAAAVVAEARRIAREFAKLDGYDVVLRTLEVNKRAESLAESKSWRAPIRVYVRNDDWHSEDGQLMGSHDAQGNVRPEYVASITLYEDGKLKEELLDPDCIEAHGWNLSAGQYKPFTFATVKSDKSVADMIRDLKVKEQEFIVGLDKLLAMVEGRE